MGTKTPGHENRRRTRQDPPFGLLDTGIFAENRYWDVEITHAKASPHTIYTRIKIRNRGAENPTLHLLPTLTFQNTWSWGDGKVEKPRISLDEPGLAAWAVVAHHETLGSYHFYGNYKAQPVLRNLAKLWVGEIK